MAIRNICAVGIHRLSLLLFSEGGKGERKAPEYAFMSERHLNLEAQDREAVGQEQGCQNGFVLHDCPQGVGRPRVRRRDQLLILPYKIHTCLARLCMSPAPTLVA